MIFGSQIFLFLFLPLILSVFFLLRFLVGDQRDGKGVVLATTVTLFSSFFYSWGEPGLVWLLLGSGALAYFGSLVLNRLEGCWQHVVFVVLLSGLIAPLLYFKYRFFLIESFRSFRFLDSEVSSVVVPIGISFFTFQNISYLSDVYCRRFLPERSLIRYLSYVTFFPQLIAGPIVRYSDVRFDLFWNKQSLEKVYSGLFRFALGLSKKVLIADRIGEHVDLLFSEPTSSLSLIVCWYGAIAYALQIFYDFSAYSDMAIGLGLVFGVRLPENFIQPYRSRSVREFWRRWHRTLSLWFRDYVYIPLGGDRGGRSITYLNLTIVFLLCGLWHGANWTFVFWGIGHGLFLVGERFFCKEIGGTSVANVWLGRFYTFAVVTVLWVLFRSESIGQAYLWYSHMFGLAFGEGALDLPISLLWGDVKWSFLVGLIFCQVDFKGVQCYVEQRQVLRYLRDVFVLVVFVLALIYIVDGAYSPFIYFNF